MKQVQISELLSITKIKSPAISIYVPLFQRRSGERVRIKLKGALKNAKALIPKDIFKKSFTEQFDEAEAEFAYLAKEFPKGGLGVFITPSSMQYVVFPWMGAEISVVSDSFHIKPLVSWSQQPKNYNLLSVSKKWVSLSIGDRSGLIKVGKAMLPEWEPNRRNVGKKETHIEPKELERRHYYLEIDKALVHLMSSLSGQTRILIIAGEAHFTKFVKNRITYPYTLTSTIDISPKTLTGKDIHERCMKLLDDAFEKDKAQFIEDLMNGECAHAIHDIAKASIEGRIQNLLVAEDHVVWGKLNRINGDIQIHTSQMNSSDDDILDDISEEVLKHKGEVMVLPQKEIPGKQLLYASMRW